MDTEPGLDGAKKQGGGRWDREQVAKKVLEFRSPTDSEVSQREFCKTKGIPRATFQSWLKREASLKASAEALAFFESPAGLAFLHKIQIACALCIGLVSPGGVRIICLFLELTGLGEFIAPSYGAQYNYVKKLHTKLDQYGKEQRDKGAEHLRQTLKQQPLGRKQIIALMDENFHEGPCLVAMDAASNFILTEQHSETRNKEAWDQAMEQGLKGLPVQIVAVNADEGKALKAYITTTANVPHLCELFHVQHEITKGTSAALKKRERDAEKALSKALDNELKARAELTSLPKDSGESYVEGPPLKAHIQARKADVKLAREVFEQASGEREQMREAVRSISSNYHPFELDTGQTRTKEQVEAGLTEAFDKMEHVAKLADLPERSTKSLKKSRRLLESMVATVAFFHCLVGVRLKALELNAEVHELVANLLIPLEYIKLSALRCGQADKRQELREAAERIGERLAVDAVWRGLPEPFQTQLLRFSQDTSKLFVRSDSALEGRNGQLSLQHHGSHRLSSGKLRALTVVHNYFLLRADGTTAAERFFGAPPDDMFCWLLQHMPWPSRPAQKRSNSPRRQAA